jgi:hypothetical protein
MGKGTHRTRPLAVGVVAGTRDSPVRGRRRRRLRTGRTGRRCSPCRPHRTQPARVRVLWCRERSCEVRRRTAAVVAGIFATMTYRTGGASSVFRGAPTRAGPWVVTRPRVGEAQSDTGRYGRHVSRGGDFESGLTLHCERRTSPRSDRAGCRPCAPRSGRPPGRTSRTRNRPSGTWPCCRCRRRSGSCISRGRRR